MEVVQQVLPDRPVERRHRRRRHQRFRRGRDVRLRYAGRRRGSPLDTRRRAQPVLGRHRLRRPARPVGEPVQGQDAVPGQSRVVQRGERQQGQGLRRQRSRQLPAGPRGRHGRHGQGLLQLPDILRLQRGRNVQRDLIRRGRRLRTGRQPRLRPRRPRELAGVHDGHDALLALRRPALAVGAAPDRVLLDVHPVRLGVGSEVRGRGDDQRRVLVQHAR